MGISEEGLKKLFTDFSKLQENAGRNLQGTGLGLSICKKIIEKMGGSVKAVSELGKGTEFHMNFKTMCKVSPSFFKLKGKPRINSAIEIILKHPEREELQSSFQRDLERSK